MSSFPHSDKIYNFNNVVLNVNSLSKNFGTTKVLQNVSLQACKGDVISLLGSSGSGKSTLLRCLNFLERPDSGTVSVMGENISYSHSKYFSQLSASVTRLRQRMGMVFQNYHLWPHLTLLQNITETPVHVMHISPNQAIEYAEVLLRRVGLYEKRNYYPVQLSGGQQQRGSIARALAVNPEILLLDEPTSALDPEHVGEVLAVIQDLAQEGRTMLIVTHEISFAREVSSQILFLNQGSIDSAGSPYELFNGGGSQRFNAFVQMPQSRSIYTTS